MEAGTSIGISVQGESHKHTIGSYAQKEKRKTNPKVGLLRARCVLCHTFDLYNDPVRMVFYVGIAVTRVGLESWSR